MDKLFARQLAKATGPDGEVDLKVLGGLVTNAYEQADRDRRRTDRSIRLMIEELEEASEKKVEYAARHDALTDLPNRVAFNEYLARAVERAAAQDTQFAILGIDLDHFKEVNEVFGHAVADRLLQEFANHLRTVSGGAFLAHLGADDFNVIVTDGHQPAASEELARHLQALVSQGFRIDGHVIRLALSIGVAIYPCDGADAASLLVNVDAALSRAKRDGHGSLRFFEAKMDQQQRERSALQHELGSAIEHNQLKLFYQPQARIDGEIIGFRGAAALGSSVARAGGAERFHSARRRWRHDRPDRRVGSAGSLPSGGVMVEAAGVAVNLSPVQFHAAICRHSCCPI